MKILLIVPWYPSKQRPLAGIFFREQARALAERGHAVAVFHPDLRFNLGGEPTGFFYSQNTGVAEYTLRRRNRTPFFGMGIVAQRMRMVQKLYRTYEAEFGRPDVVHLHCCELAYEAISLCRRFELPLVYTEHYSAVLGDPPRLLQAKLRAALKESRVSVAVSGALKAAMQRYGGPVTVVPNGVDMRRFVPRPFPVNEFVFGAMGSLVPVKGHELLIRAFAKALPRLDGAVLRVAGDGSEREKLVRLAAELGVAGSVVFKGAVPRQKVPDFFNGCHCAVCSSYRETFGVVVIEALACGRPVIATRCGGPEAIVGAEDGVLCEPDNESALAEAFVFMRQNYDSYSQRQIRERCVSRFSWQAVCPQIEKAYALALSKNKRISVQDKEGGRCLK